MKSNIPRRTLAALFLFPALLQAQMAYRTGGSGEWLATDPPFGLAKALSVSSPVLAAGETAWIEIDVTGPSRVDFFWTLNLAESPVVDGRLQLLLDGGLCASSQGYLSGTQSVSAEIGPGAHVLRWQAAVTWYSLPAGNARVFGLQTTALTGTPLRTAISPAGSSPQPEMAWVSREQIYEPRALPGSVSWSIIGPSGAPDAVAALRSGEPQEEVWGDLSFVGPGVIELRVEHIPSHWDPDFGEFFLLPDHRYFDLLNRGSVHTALPPRTHVIAVGSGRHALSFYPGDGYTTVDNAIVRTGPYGEWLAALSQLPTTTDPAADPDGDGITTLAEYAFGLDPTRPDPEPSVRAEVVEGRLAVSAPRVGYDVSLLTYTVQTSDDLVTWTNHADIAPSDSPDGSHLVFHVPLGTIQGGGFARVRVSMIP